jgi:hypothetical protein
LTALLLRASFEERWLRDSQRADAQTGWSGTPKFLGGDREQFWQETVSCSGSLARVVSPMGNQETPH